MISARMIAATRFGYGIRAGEEPPETTEALLAQVRSTEKPLFPIEGVAGRIDTIAAYTKRLRQLRERRKAGDEDRGELNALQKAARKRRDADQRARLAQAVLSPAGFHERLASFWLNHFTISVLKGGVMQLQAALFEAQAIRPHMGGSFLDLLSAASLHPAMLHYLDQAASLGPNSLAASARPAAKGVNENFARELLELHTLGVDGGYEQGDVRQMALLLTGLSIGQGNRDAVYRPRRAEPGEFTVLGKVYVRSDEPFVTARTILADLAADPRTARNISRKLVSHFITEEPRPDLVDAMARTWEKTGGDLTAVYATMLDSPLAWQAPLVKTKMPFDYVVSVLRALGAEQSDLLDDVDRLADPMAAEAMDGNEQKPESKEGRVGRAANRAVNRLGQPIWSPAAAAGYEDGSAFWEGSSQLAERIGFAQRAIRLLDRRHDPRIFVEAVLGDLAREDTVRIVGQAPTRETGLLLALISPEFNRR